MNKRKVAEIVKFSVEKNIQNKAFVIFNIILCLIIVIILNLSNIQKVLKDNDIDLFTENYSIEILDKTGFEKGAFEKFFKDYENIKINYVSENNYTKDNIPDDLVNVELKENENQDLNVVITSKEAINSELYDNIISISSKIRNQIFSNKNGINEKDLNELSKDLEVEEVWLGLDAENSETKEIIKNVSVILVYFVLIFVLAMIANEIVSEKVSKSIEYVLTSVDAKDYLLAKVLGVTITIIIQVLYSFVYFLIGNSINLISNFSDVSSTLVSNNDTFMQSLDISLLVYILVMIGYLIFTVFFMSMIQSALSARATSVAEASNTTSLLITIIIFLYFISLACIGPYIKVTPFMYIISCIPIISTFFVPSMMIIGQATTLQIIISFVLLILGAPLLFNLCAKNFKNGVLDYTGKNNKKKKEKKERTIKEEQEYLIKANKMKKFAFVIGISLIIWLTLQVLGSIILPSIVKMIFKNILSEKSIYWIYFMIVSIISLIIPIKIVESYTEKEYKTSKKTGLKLSIKIILIGFGLVFLINILETNILNSLGSDYEVIDSSQLVTSQDSLIDKILFILGVAIVPGIFEELFMRKAILNYGKQFGNYFTITLSAILFGLIHQNLQQGIFAFFIGLVLAVIALKTCNIKLTMIIHMLNNLISALFSIFQDNDLILSIISIIVIALSIVGIIWGLICLKKNKGLKLDKEKFKEEYKLIFKNYTFDIAIVLFILLTILSEKYLRL